MDCLNYGHLAGDVVDPIMQDDLASWSFAIQTDVNQLQNMTATSWMHIWERNIVVLICQPLPKAGRQGDSQV